MKIRVATIETAYSTENHCYIDNGNGVEDSLAEACFCDGYEITGDREATAEETEKFLYALSLADENHAILQYNASKYALGYCTIEELLTDCRL